MYQPEQCKKKCEWRNCLAGMGIAGNGRCFLDGAWWMMCCPNFVDEDEHLKRSILNLINKYENIKNHPTV